MNTIEYKARKIFYVVALFTLTFFINPIIAQVYDYDAVPGPRDTYTTALFRIYIPESVSVIKGIYFYLDGTGGDSRYIASSTSSEYQSFRDFLEAEGFATMGTMVDGMDMSSGIGNAVLTALDTFAVRSSRPEIALAPMFLNGHSFGGQFAYHFTIWKPSRVIGFITQKGGNHTTSFSPTAIPVPGYMFVGENDLDYRLINLPGIFYQHRPFGALWILAIQPGAGHERVTDRNLLDHYFLDVVALRLPETIVPGEPVVLKTVDESVGWSGNETIFEIGKYACYNANQDSASWFPSQRVAQDWQAFVSSNTVTDTIPCYASITLNQDTLYLDDVAVGDTISTTFLVYNDGAVPLEVSSIASSNNLFSIDNTSATIQPGEDQLFKITFSPDNAGEEEALITITSNDPDFPNVDLTAIGNSVVPLQTLSKELIDFNTVEVTESKSDTFYVRNSGSVRFSIQITEPKVNKFSIDPTYGILEPGDSLAVSVTFSPDNIGNYLDTIFVANTTNSNMVLLSGNGIITGIADNNSGQPDKVTLYQNYPNPFNPTTTISYYLPNSANVHLSVFNVIGEEVTLLVNQTQSAGNYNAIWDASNVVSGLYIYNLQVNQPSGVIVEVRKMILLK